MRRFTRFLAVDWSGQAVARPRGIAAALCSAGHTAPALIEPPGGWSRQAMLDLLQAEAAAGGDLLIGCDFSAALPFADAGGYFPGWADSPADAPALWRLVDLLAAADPHLGAAPLLRIADVARHFRQPGRPPGDRVLPGIGRLRVTERACRDGGHGPAVSSFTLIGPAQVGKASLAGMRLLHRLRGAVPVWPFDPVPARGPLLVELYTTLAARAAGVPAGRSKLRDAASLTAALARLDSTAPTGLARLDDHATDALLAAAWLRRAAENPALWRPAALTPALARTEGWTFGVS